MLTKKWWQGIRWCKYIRLRKSKWFNSRVSEKFTCDRGKCCNDINEIIKSALDSVSNDSLLLIVIKNKNDKAESAYYNDKHYTLGSSTVDNNSCLDFRIDIVIPKKIYMGKVTI